MPQIRQLERRIKVLELLRQGLTETKIAETLGVSRETIVRDVRWLRKNLVYDFTLITNEILSKLHKRIDEMDDRDLIAFLGKLIPRKIEASTAVTGELVVKVSPKLVVKKDDSANNHTEIRTAQ